MRKVSVWLTTASIILAMLLWLPGSAAAAGPTLTVDSQDTPLVIRGILDGQATNFSANVRLTATGGDATGLLLMASDVRHATDHTYDIDRSNVTIPSGITLSSGQPRDVRVTINNVRRPGDYAGEIQFLLPGQTEAEALVIPLEMHITATPDVQALQPNLTVQVVRCATPIDCGVATWLLPDSVVRDDWSVFLDNRTVAPVEVTGATVIVHGEKTGNAVGAGDIRFSVPASLSASQAVPVAMLIDRNRLSPDHYTGALRFAVQGQDTPVTVNLDLSVRDGPIWPILIVVFGVLAGRLARGAETPQAKVQDKLYPRVAELRAQAGKVTNPDAQSYLAKKLAGAQRRIAAGTEAEDALTAALTDFDVRVQLLSKLEELESRLTSLNLEALKKELQPKIQAARAALIKDPGGAEDIEAARRACAEIEQRLGQAQSDATMGEAKDALAGLAAIFGDVRDRLEALKGGAVVERPGGSRWNWLARLLAALSGSQWLGVELRYWLVRPLLFLILLVGLTLLGLQTLYVNAGSTFGASGIYDYLGLFLWGLSADVAQRTLQGLIPQGKPG